MADTYYSTGTISVSNGGTTVTGTGTKWEGVIFEGDLLHLQGLVAVVTADAASDTSLTIAAWAGTTASGATYKLLFTSDAVRQSERARQLLEELSTVQANGRGLFYTFDTTTTDADPGAGKLRLDNATQSSATAAYLDNLDADGATVSGLIDTWDDLGTSGDRGQLWVRSIATPATFRAYAITGSVVDGTGYRKLTLSHIGGSGTLANDDEIMVSFAPTGSAGATGGTGADGGITMTFSTTTTASDPGAGKFRLNNATPSSATAAYIDNVEALGGASITALLDSWDDAAAATKGQLLIVSKLDPAIFQLYNVTGTVVDSTGYRTVTIANVTGNGALADLTPCVLAFSASGNDGYSPGYRLAFSTTTTDADPGAGTVRFNHATFASITYVYVDNQDAAAVSLTTWLDGLDDVINANARAYLRFQKATDPTIYAEFAVVGPVVDGTGYRKIPVSPIAGAVPSNGTVLVATASKNGADAAASFPDQVRVNDASLGGYQAKSQSGFTGYRRGKNTIWDGFADSSGVNAGRSANYSVDTSAKCIKPTDTGTDEQSSTGTNTASSGWTYVNRAFAVDNSTTVTGIWIWSDTAYTGTARILLRNSSTSYTFLTGASVSFSHSGGSAWQFFTFASPVSIPGSGTYHCSIFGAGASPTPRGMVGAVSRAYYNGDVTGTQASGWTEEASGNAPSIGVRYQGTTANMKYSSTLQTADAAVTSVTAIFEIDPITSVTLGTDLTGIATCNGWTNSASVMLTSVGAGQAGRTLVKAVATGLTSGTSFGIELQYANNKNAPIYFVEVRAE